MLTVYKASAGSGKTYQLVTEYLKLLLKNPVSYRHILAVTFTNKATSEMKSRVLEQLFLLASNDNSKYLNNLQSETGFSEETIRSKARVALKNILHDYNRFAISTIDSFTQRVIKAFNRELGISPDFTLELDDSLILEEAVDRMLGKLGGDKNLFRWLVDFSREKITENKGQRIEENIKSLGQELFREKFQIFFSENKNSGYTRETIDRLRNELNKLMAVFENELKKKAGEALQHIKNHGYSTDDFLHKLSGIAGFLTSLSEKKIKEPGVRVLAAEESAEKWFSKTPKPKAELLELTETRLLPLLREILDYYRKHSTNYYSAVAVNSQLRMLGILTDLKEEIKTLLHEKGALQLSDANLLLSRIIGESESPFIYEKTGNWFNHFMLDEFQDTSSLQWKNFKPLIANSLSQGHHNLLVGDVKQSIYRWRNSDWNILAEQVETDFPYFRPETKTLGKNWRSDKNIIDFNNSAFLHLKEAFENNLFAGNDHPDWQMLRDKFSNVYSDFHQEPGNSSAEKKGWVQVNFLNEDDFEEKSAELLVQQVKQLQDNGLKASDIAILIRKNREGAILIEEFLMAAKQEENAGYNLSVLSNESLFLHASKAVLFVIALIELFIDPENKISKATALQLWSGGLKPELIKAGIIPPQEKTGVWQLEKKFETEFDTELQPRFNEVKQKSVLTSPDETITEICAHFQLFNLENELPFLQTLIDKAAEIKTSVSNDLSNFLFWWNEKGFLTSVNVNDEVDSVRLLTVHKAKGLEFKAVLIPFLNWNTKWVGNQAPVLWCRTETEPFNQLPLLPVKATSALENTWFRHDYFEETANSYTDTMNLIYVAFTRAVSVLVINTTDADMKKPAKDVNALFKHSLLQMSRTEAFADCWNEENTVFTFGKPEKKKSETTASNLVLIKKYQFNPTKNKIRLRLDSDEFWVHGEKEKSGKNRGRLKHEILSEIIMKSDVKKACQKALSEGKIDAGEREKMERELTENLEQPEVAHWFDGSWTVINERNLLTPDKILRPDRIMISGKNALVVDYKTGEKKSDNYNRQVARYAKTLKETGFEKVEGYLWYVSLNEVEKVGEY
jgi:ATP-dependent exoDNAse (exonuclease V) beta subunit